MRVAKKNPSDPLFIIFEQHLYNFQDEELDRNTFVENVIRDYFSFLGKKNITVPKSLEMPILEELSVQVRALLLKKIYGCLNIHEFQQKLSTSDRRGAKSRYTRLKRSA